KVWIKAKNTKLLQKADATSKVIAVLQPGEEVAWQSGPEAKEFHKVKSKKEGYVYFANLSLQPSEPEFKPNGEKVDPKVFANSGAATKALSEGAIAYGTKKLSREDAVRSVIAMEAIAAKVDPTQLAAHAKSVGIASVVGEKDKP
ncbi:MAG: SH3 domain-containing protein, partial [Myxococcaceae bacterium]